MKKAAIYARVNTEEQGKASLVDDCRRYAEGNGFEVIQIIDDTVSGKRSDRPGMRHLRDLVTGKEVDAIIIYSRDRLSRNLIALCELLNECEDNEVELLSVSEDLYAGE